MKYSLTTKQLVWSLIATAAVVFLSISGKNYYWQSQLQPMGSAAAIYMKELSCGSPSSAARHIDPNELSRLHVAMGPVFQLAKTHNNPEVREWMTNTISTVRGGAVGNPDQYEAFALLFLLAPQTYEKVKALCGSKIVAEYTYKGLDGDRELAYSVYKDGVVLQKDRAMRMRAGTEGWYVRFDIPPEELVSNMLSGLQSIP